MMEWQEYKLSDIANIVDCEHKTAPIVENSEFYSVRTSNISNGKIDFHNSNRVDFQTYLEWTKREVPKNGDIILAREAPVGEVGMVKNGHKVCLGQRTVLLSIKNDNVDNYYLLYYLVNPIIKFELISRSTGSVVSHLNMKDIREFEIQLPPIQEQQAIANILSSLDDKIDLLHRQNKTLEAMAETLFRQWFIKESEGLKNATFGKWIETTFGGEWGKETPESEFITPVFCIRGTDIADLQTGLATKTPIRFIKKNKFESIEPKDGDLIIEISGGTENQSTGRTLYINAEIKSLYNLPLVFSNFCRLIRPFKQEYSFFVYCYIQYLYKQDEFFNLENGSSGIKNLNYKALLFELDYPMPDEEKVLVFDKTVKIYFEKINKNKKQIQILEKLRDNLLPKLMSGEVRVKCP